MRTDPKPEDEQTPGDTPPADAGQETPPADQGGGQEPKEGED
ncbi:MAG TPA: hypothetical protein VJB57_04090 [Dehalococcoidia bacterium]|nr:hypothetical protein [Dehalococcoidia bacterium]